MLGVMGASHEMEGQQGRTLPARVHPTIPSKTAGQAEGAALRRASWSITGAGTDGPNEKHVPRPLLIATVMD